MDPFVFVTLVTLLPEPAARGWAASWARCEERIEPGRQPAAGFAGGVMTLRRLPRPAHRIRRGGGDVRRPGGGRVWRRGAVVAGVAVVYGLNLVIDRRTPHEVAHTGDDSHPKTHDDIDELVHADHLAEHRQAQ